MKNLVTTALLATAVATTGCADSSPTAGGSDFDHSAAFAHESNNRAELSGMQNGNTITGHSIVNFTKNGKNAWRSNVSLTGDLAPGTYTFIVISPDGATEFTVCSFSVPGRQGCSSDTNVGGFATAEVVDSDGAIVASGSYARRGGTRFKD